MCGFETLSRRSLMMSFDVAQTLTNFNTTVFTFFQDRPISKSEYMVLFILALCLLISLRKQPTFHDATTGFPGNDIW